MSGPKMKFRAQARKITDHKTSFSLAPKTESRTEARHSELRASGARIAALYGLIPNKLGFCGPKQELLKKFIAGKLSTLEIIPILEKFEAAYAYYQLIAQKNKISNPFNKKVIEAYWLGNELLDEFILDDLRTLIIEKFCRPGLLSKKEAWKKAELIPRNSIPHHSFHVLVLGSITGTIDFTDNIKLKDACRIGWGRVTEKKHSKANGQQKITVEYQPLEEGKKIKLGKMAKKEILWDTILLPEIKIGDWISFHWNYAIQKLNKENIANLYKYTQNTLNSSNK